jgi:hypothetical protein
MNTNSKVMPEMCGLRKSPPSPRPSPPGEGERTSVVVAIEWFWVGDNSMGFRPRKGLFVQTTFGGGTNSAVCGGFEARCFRLLLVGGIAQPEMISS